MTERVPSLAEVVREAIEHRLASLHVCLPGEIVSYDVATQTASVRPTIKSVMRHADGQEESTALPVIPSVPVAHPRAGAWFVHLPLAPGDTVLLVFGERSLDQWRLLGGVQDPLDLRKHDLTDAIAIPSNLYPDALALTGVTNNHLSLGRAGGSTIHVKLDGTIAVGSETPTDSAATALKVATELNALKAAFATWVPVINDGGLALKVILTALFLTWPGDVASTKVKVDP